MRLGIAGWFTVHTVTLLSWMGAPAFAATLDADIEYAQVGTHHLDLDIYRPDAYCGDLPVVLWVHGGGWKPGDKAHGRGFLETIADEGFAVVSANYRLSDVAVFPAQIHDLKGAVRWLRAHGHEYDLDTLDLAVMGSSAGGHLAALLGTSAGDPILEGDVGGNELYCSGVAAVVDLYGPTDLPNLHDHCLARGGCAIDHTQPDSPESKLLGAPAIHVPARAMAASALYYVDGNEPPFLLLHGDIDVMIPIQQAYDLHAALVAEGVDATLIEATGYGHELCMRMDYLGEILDFLDANLTQQADAAGP
jgi:acetyl esterase/lipase